MQLPAPALVSKCNNRALNLMPVLSDLPADALLTLFNHVVAAANTGQLLKLALVSRAPGHLSHSLCVLRHVVYISKDPNQATCVLCQEGSLVHVVSCAMHQVCRQFLNAVAQADWFWQQHCTTLGWLR